MATINPRVNITVAPELKKWFEEQAKTMGITMSGLMSVALQQYRQQQEAITTMKDIPTLMEELKKLQAKQEELEAKSN